jgi:hypothetical protein
LCQLQAEAKSSAFGFASSLDDLVDLPCAQPVCALLLGFLPNDSKDLGLRNREAYIVPDAQQHCAWAAPLLDDKGPAFVFDLAKKFAEICSRVQGSDDNPTIHKLSISIN